LAEYGNTPKGFGKGHKDGWGIVAYEKGKSVLFERNYKNAYKDPKYLKASEKAEKRKSDILIAHLRKASVGANNLNNAHPFLKGNFSFCQNGTIFGSEKIPLKAKFEKIIKGSTDSERFFLYSLQLLEGKKKAEPAIIRKAIKNGVSYIRKNLDFSAINTIFSDGKYLWALREVNEKNKFVKEKKLLDQYYSLFIGKSDDCDMISSEKMPFKNVKWKTIKNHELIEIDVENNKVRSYKI